MVIFGVTGEVRTTDQIIKNALVKTTGQVRTIVQVWVTADW